MTMRQGKASVDSLNREWTDRYTYCTRQEARLSIFEYGDVLHSTTTPFSTGAFSPVRYEQPEM